MSKYVVQQQRNINMKNIVLAQLTKTAQHVLHIVTALYTVSVYTVSVANNISTVLVMNASVL